MKMSKVFLKKQLLSLKSQVESLLEAAGATNLATFDSIKVKDFQIKVGGKFPTISNVAEAGKIIAKPTTAGYDPVLWLLEKWDALMSWFDEVYTKAKTWIESTAAAKSIGKYYESAMKKLGEWKNEFMKEAKRVKLQGQSDWFSLNYTMKTLFAVGAIGLLISIIIMGMNGASIENAWGAFKTSLSDSGNKISAAAKSFGASAEGFKSAIKLVYEIVATPLKAVFAIVGSLLEDGLGYVLGMSAVCFGVFTAILYYRSSPVVSDKVGPYKPVLPFKPAE